MNIDHWLIPLPLNDSQRNDFNSCQDKLRSLLNLPLRITCQPTEVLWTHANIHEHSTITINNSNPLKMYWQRNLSELHLFLKPNRKNQTKLDANIIEIHKRRRLQITRFVKQNLNLTAVTLSFSHVPTTNHHILVLTIAGKHCVLEIQIPSTDNEFVYRGTYRKHAEDTQSRTITALFNCTIHIDNDKVSLFNEYDLCRLLSTEEKRT